MYTMFRFFARSEGISAVQCERRIDLLWRRSPGSTVSSLESIDSYMYIDLPALVEIKKEIRFHYV